MVDWPNRWGLYVCLDEYQGRKNVRFDLYRVEMPRVEEDRLFGLLGDSRGGLARLLIEDGIVPTKEDYEDIEYVSQMWETFDAHQVEALRRYFARHPEMPLLAYPAPTPEWGYSGVALRHAREPSRFPEIEFHKEVDYELAFKVNGVADVEIDASARTP